MKKIFLVEDEINLAEIVKDELTETGYEVHIANTGKDCLDKMNSIKPDLFILDIKLPDISGLKLLEEIRVVFPDVAIMICTAFDSFKTDYEVWSAKISDYIVKPVDLDDLKRRIHWILGE